MNRIYKDYYCKTTGHRRLSHSIGNARRRAARFNKPLDETTLVSISFPALEEAVAEHQTLQIQKDWLEVFGDRLVEHLEKMPKELKSEMCLSDIKMFKTRRYPKNSKTQAR